MFFFTAHNLVELIIAFLYISGNSSGKNDN